MIPPQPAQGAVFAEGFGRKQGAEVPEQEPKKALYILY